MTPATIAALVVIGLLAAFIVGAISIEAANRIVEAEERERQRRESEAPAAAVQPPPAPAQPAEAPRRARRPVAA